MLNANKVEFLNSFLGFNKFKATLILAICMVGFITQSTAQKDHIITGFSINNYKYNRASFDLNDSVDFKGSGYSIGFAFEKQIFKKNSIVVGFNFVQRNDETKIFKIPNARRTNWASFPITYNYYLNDNFALNAGAQFDHLIFKQKIVYFKDSTLQKSGYTKYDINLIVGCRLKLNHYEIFYNYNYGLIKIYNLYGYYNADTSEHFYYYVKSGYHSIGFRYLLY